MTNNNTNPTKPITPAQRLQDDLRVLESMIAKMGLAANEVTVEQRHGNLQSQQVFNVLHNIKADSLRVTRDIDRIRTMIYDHRYERAD